MDQLARRDFALDGALRKRMSSLLAVTLHAAPDDHPVKAR
jgi:hypothetical protein